FQYGAAGKNKIRAVRPDAGIGNTLFETPAHKPGDDRIRLLAGHPEAIDPATIITRQAKMNARERRDGPGSSQQMKIRTICQISERMARLEGFEHMRDILRHGLEDLGRHLTPSELLRQGDDAD